MDKISVIVPVYNVEKYLERCVNSLLQQTYENLEIILVDDGSKDRSGKICDALREKSSKIKVIHKENGGLSSARNKGLEIAEGEYIGFVDSDDWISNDMYEYLLSLSKEYDADITQIEYIFASDYPKQIKQHNIGLTCVEENENILKRYLVDGMKEIKSYPVWTKLYKAKCFRGVSFPEGQLYEDVVTNYSILSGINRYVISTKVCYFYFSNPKSITRSSFINKDFEYIKVGEQIADITRDSKVLKSYGQMTLARTYFMLLCKMVKFKCADDVDIDEFVDKALPVLRKNIYILLKSKMKYNRKIALIALCANKKFTRSIIRGGRK